MGNRPDVVVRAIERYNRYRAPMARATLIDRDEATYSVRFAGPFMHTCCPDEYLEDLLYELVELGIDRERTRWGTVSTVDHETVEATFTVDETPADPEVTRQ